MNRSENDTMSRASKNVENNMSKSETFKKAKLSIKTDIRENNNVYNRWSPFSDEMDIGTYSISEGFVRDTVLQHSMSVIIPLTFASA